MRATQGGRMENEKEMKKNLYFIRNADITKVQYLSKI